ncbi:hypothetical protein M5C72_02725 [Companilactobacillus allii]|uniref:Uncharacterized protein n=1 Tax=Companilactobacillus allii TaxID=1847728 RepID=A0A1P8Q2M5_9LACO|nr:hypothetical protein [Companilactobacillus allii]APX72076.1 hypothetical protein BTM29_05640 [Companilactobacillus allii]USQ69169.1 hypothetical protein M5C72_02725 [Companilactobacillus allii]
MNLTQWVQIGSSLVALVIAVFMPIYQQHVQNIRDQRLHNQKIKDQIETQNEHIDSIKKIMVGFISGDFLETTDQDMETIDHANKFFFDASSFNDWIDSRLMNIPDKRERELLMLGKGYFIDKEDMHYGAVETYGNDPDKFTPYPGSTKKDLEELCNYYIDSIKKL